MLKFAASYLPRLIRHEEHIMAVAYGRHQEAEGILHFSEGMLVATSRRLLYLVHRPGYTSFDEFAYNTVTSLSSNRNSLFTTLTLYTTMATYVIRFAGNACAGRFIDYVDQHRDTLPPSTAPVASRLNLKALDFLHSHELGVLSTLDRDGTLSSSAVHYVIDDQAVIRIVTKTDARKARNVLARPQAALTVYDTEAMQTVQVQASASFEVQPSHKKEGSFRAALTAAYGNSFHLPPMSLLRDSGLTVIKLLPTSARLLSFKDLTKPYRLKPQSGA